MGLRLSEWIKWNPCVCLSVGRFCTQMNLRTQKATSSVQNLIPKLCCRVSLLKYFSTALLCLSFLATPAFTWNNTGHMTVAELAWRDLSTSKRTPISNLLKQHPNYTLLLATNVPKNVDTNEWAFLKAATWPDMVRPPRPGSPPKPPGVTSYHRGPWHFVNYPIILPDDADHFSTANFSIPTTNILWALSNAVSTLHDPQAASSNTA